MPSNDADSVRITITIKHEIYEKIKQTSRRMGLRPATWIGMVATTKVNNIEGADDGLQ